MAHIVVIDYGLKVDRSGVFCIHYRGFTYQCTIEQSPELLNLTGYVQRLSCFSDELIRSCIRRLYIPLVGVNKVVYTSSFIYTLSWC